ncbi:hypothetical protein AAG906_003991 [Vitis piasezkii]
MIYKEKVLSTYLPYVIERSDTIEEENRVVKLYSLGNFNEDYNGPWTSINADHPSTFDTLIILSGLFNFIDGLWSSFGDERIIILTTNHKERLDPALLRLTLEIAEELLKNKDVDVSLEGLIKFLEKKKILVEDSEKSNAEGVGGAKECKIMIRTKRVNRISPNIV